MIRTGVRTDVAQNGPVARAPAPSAAGLRAFRALALAGAVVACALAMLGSWTRINSAGMTCPDWPLCHGAVVPALQGGVVLEWTHRLLAFIETFVVAGVVIVGLRLRRAFPALRVMLPLLAAIFVLQVLLGGATIFLANSPLSVTVHWGTAMLLVAVLGSTALIAFRGEARAPVGFGATTAYAASAGLAYVTMCVGSFVSSSGAGLACPGVPGCGTTTFGQTFPQEIQMAHRLLALALFVFVVVSAWQWRRSRSGAARTYRVALGLIALQVTLGILNVVWLLPAPLREAHAANAIATFLALTLAAVLESLGAGEAPSASERARAAAARS